MMKMLKKMMEDKAGDAPSFAPGEKDAKMEVLKEIRDLCAKELGEGVKGVKKVTVAAPDAEGLKMGLKKAEDLVGGADEEAGEDPAEEAAETPAEESAEQDELGDMSNDEIDALLAKLQAKKAAKK